MRLLRLDLEKYGHFSGQAFDFRPDAALHIVHGRNEAGKSSSLAAITDLFFRIETRTAYDFLHEGKDMRLGAVIQANSGASLAFKRRKGNKNTLLAPDDSPLNDDSLLPYLGGISRDVFSHAFGLNAENLRRGAEEMLDSNGDLGATLFAAASGLRGLSDIRRALDDQAEIIFTPNASKSRIFYQALGRLETARTQIKALELRAGDFKTLNNNIASLADQLTQINDRRAEQTGNQVRLARLKRILPLVRELDILTEALDALGDLPDATAHPTVLLRDTLGRFDRALAADDLAGHRLDKAARDVRQIEVDTHVLTRSPDIQRLFSGLGAYVKDQQDLPRIQAETDDYAAELGQLALRLGLEKTTVLDDRQPSDAALALVRNLIGEGKVIAGERQSHATAVVAETEALAAIDRQRGERGAAVDPQPLRERFAAVSPILGQVKKLEDLSAAIAADARTMDIAAARLNPPVSALAVLAGASLPSGETIAGFRRQLDDLDGEVKRLTAQKLEVAKTVRGVESRLAVLSEGKTVPTQAVIAIERGLRDAAWQALRHAWLGGQVPSGPELVAGIAAFESHSAQADRLADAAVDEADRVAHYAGETRRLAEEQARYAEVEAQLAAAEEACQTASDQWRAAWAAVEIVPLSPLEMMTWRAAVIALLERADAGDLSRDQAQRIQAEIDAVKPVLASLARDAGLADLPGSDAGLQIRQIEGRLASLTLAWDTARDVETRVRDAQNRLERLKGQAVDHAFAFDAWHGKWQAATVALGLAATVTIDEAEAALLVWRDVPGAILQRENRARRVACMRRDMEQFEREARALVAEVAPDLASLPPVDAITHLSGRLTEAWSNQAIFDKASRQLTEAQQERDQAQQDLTDAEAALTASRTRLGIDGDLAVLLTTLVERDRLLDVLEYRRRQLALSAEGMDEDTLRRDLLSFDADRAEADIKAIADELDTLDNRAREVFAEHDRAVRERQAHEQGTGAEVAAQQRKGAEAELLDATREWAVLKLGALLIGQVVEGQRASQQDPLMARASSLLAMLTGDSYAGLGQDFDDDDRVRLVALRASGERVPISGLSEGTRDQLYLALRLAYLEDYAGRTEAPPFVGDDLFTSFDEARTRHGLLALAQTGPNLQKILFTHHRHVVDIARDTLAAGVDVIELG